MSARQPDLFGMHRRAPNRTPPKPPGTVVTFLPSEWALLKMNRSSGGMQDQENWLFQNIDRETGQCVMDDARLRRTINYCREGKGTMGRGGPNGRIRKACKPALARIGIVVD
jgi:hypothetical protein